MLNKKILSGKTKPFSINIARKTYGHPANPCKHLQCMYHKNKQY